LTVTVTCVALPASNVCGTFVIVVVVGALVMVIGTGVDGLAV
jgi:hypothetical protein